MSCSISSTTSSRRRIRSSSPHGPRAPQATWVMPTSTWANTRSPTAICLSPPSSTNSRCAAPHLTYVQRQRITARLKEVRDYLASAPPAAAPERVIGGRRRRRRPARLRSPTPILRPARLIQCGKDSARTSHAKKNSPGDAPDRLALAAASRLVGCATVPPAERNPRDPWQRVNRGVYKFNDAVDTGRRRSRRQDLRARGAAADPHRGHELLQQLTSPDAIVNALLQGQLRPSRATRDGSWSTPPRHRRALRSGLAAWD